MQWGNVCDKLWAYLSKDGEDFSDASVTDPDLAAIQDVVWTVSRWNGPATDWLQNNKQWITNARQRIDYKTTNNESRMPGNGSTTKQQTMNHECLAMDRLQNNKQWITNAWQWIDYKTTNNESQMPGNGSTTKQQTMNHKQSSNGLTTKQQTMNHKCLATDRLQNNKQ